ncbi:MAG: GIY-YIG nuclease family protein [Salinivirgaceae bacterium]|nr:GIY-YIG nuclease family protein [Salinivirgaceae bacterium]
MKMFAGFVYLLSNQTNTVLYIGVTNDLMRRVAEHKLKINKGVTFKYNCHKLVYYERFERFADAINREKQLKNWKRKWKEELIENTNPSWRDLSDSIGLTVEFMDAVAANYNREKNV